MLENLTILFPLATALFALLWFLRWTRVHRLGGPEDGPAPDYAMGRNDWLILVGLTLLYALVAFTGLGSLRAPQSFHHFQGAGDAAAGQAVLGGLPVFGFAGDDEGVGIQQGFGVEVAAEDADGGFPGDPAAREKVEEVAVLDLALPVAGEGAPEAEGLPLEPSAARVVLEACFAKVGVSFDECHTPYSPFPRKI